MAADPQYEWFRGDHGLRAINHVFMPRRLPGTFDSEEADKPELCLSTMLDCICEIPNFTSMNCISLTKRMLCSWAELQRSFLDLARVEDAVLNMEAKDQIAFYLVAQNATIVVRQQEGQVRVWGFDVHAKTATLTKAPQTLYGVFPRAAVMASTDVVLTTDFAKQLVALHRHSFNDAQRTSVKHGTVMIETRDATKPKYVFDWLLSAVATEVDQTAPRLVKKVRDAVVYGKGDLPWRRSGIFLSLKWVLHASLVSELGHVSGTYLFKACMLIFACRLAEEQHLNVDMDLRQQMMAKCARKLSKLELLLEKEYQNCTNALLKQIYLHVTSSSHRTLSVLYEKSKNLWREYQESWRKESNWVLKPGDLNFRTDIEQKLPQSKEFLLNLINRKAVTNQVSEERAVTTFSMSWDIPDNRLWILHHEEEDSFRCFMNLTINSSIESLCNALDTYVERADISYRDPYGWSRKILCVYCKVAVIDYRFCQEFPVAKEHASDIDPSLLRHLVVVDSKLLQVLEKVEDYFRNRNALARYPGPLEAHVSPSSFTVRFAEGNYSMEETRKAIVEESNERELAKREEIRRDKETIERLRKLADSSEHEYRRTLNYNSVYEKVHVSSCKRCGYENQIQTLSAQLFEHLLPKRLDYQRAIVFELTSSKNVNLWWDAIVVTNRVVHDSTVKKLEIYLHWSTSQTLTKWKIYQPHKVQLVSTRKSVLQTHYRSRTVLSATEDDFIVENASNCVYAGDEFYNPGKVQQKCTYALEKESYKPLQCYMGFTHQESQVLADQYLCSSAMKLSEFGSFGCLRAGQRLQWHHLFAAFHQRTLSFGQKDVMQLVCQAAWQACEVTDTFPQTELKWMRNVHAVLLREGFVQEFIEELESYLMTIEKNWQNHWALGAVVILTVRIFDVLGTLKVQGSLAELNLSYIVKFLRRCRSLGTEWLGTIEAIVKDADKMDLEDLAALRRRLVEIASFIGLSYNTHTSLVSELLTDQVDILHWLRAVICIRDNTVLVNTEVPGFSGSLLQLVQRVAFQMKGRLTELSSPEVFDVCVANYYAAGTVISSGFSLVTENALWAQFRWTQSTASRGVASTPALIQINLLQGDFWIDGSPLGRLHKEITSNAIYTRLFEETVFDVVLCTDTFGARARRTKYEYSGSRFVFTQDRIDEERADGQVLHLIPDHYFRIDLPVSFSQDFSHWLCTRTKMLYFREKSFRHPKFADLHQAEFVLNCSSFVLTNKEGQVLIDINSPTAGKLAAIFERLEPRPFLHIWCPNIAEELLLVRLTRHGLDFRLSSCTGIVSSVEHVGWVVSANQNLGTLFGLRHVLLLESGSAAARKMALIPHGKLVLSPRGTTNASHHHLDIDLGDIQSPSYFSYKVDSKLRCLTGPANQTAWLYLAALHAYTSSVLRDEFTGMTGLEMAFYILQSPRCWSSRPYDATAYEILKFVSDLAPKRNYYPEHLQAMEQVTFPSIIPSLCAHDGYYFLAQKLIGDSNRLSFLYSDERKENGRQEGDDLNLKYYYDSLKNYSPLAHLDGEFKPVVNVSGERFAYSKVWQEHSKVRYVSNAVRENMVLDFEFTKESLWNSIVRYSERYEPKDMIDSKNMQSCASWETVSLPDMFFALDKHIREHWTAVNHRSFLLSFLAYTEPALHGALAALTVASCSSSTNIPSKGLLPPSFPSYCTKMPVLDTASFYEIYCCKDFYRNSGWEIREDEDVNPFRRKYNQTADSLKTRVGCIITREKSKMEGCDTNSNTAREFRTTETLTGDYGVIVNVREVNSKIADAFCRAHQYRVLKAYCAAVSEERQKHLPFPTLNLSSIENHSRPLLHLKSDYPIMKFTLSHPEVFRQSSLKQHKMEDLVDFMENLTTVDSGNEPTTHLPLTIHGDDPVSQIFLQNLKASYVNLKPKRGELSKDSESIQRSLNCHRRLLSSSLCLLESQYSDSLQVPGIKGLHMIELTYPCLPLVFFPRLLQSDCGQLSSWIAEIATLWTKVQKCERLLLHLDQGNSDAFQKELSNGLHSNWNVATMPEWLFFEMENDVSIWPVQVEVAEKMMNPDGNQHSVLQLNMGEGKTSIITPMIAAKLANGQQLLRIIVLTSLFSTNFEELALKLGGLLHKRIYIFPCRRDITIHVQDGQRILRVLEECQRLGGVILTVPEHVLSLQLKYFETCMKGDEHLARILGTILSYLHVNARDVIDEADEVLNHKYQLIYTLGGQAFPDGGQYRYAVPQVCFHLVKKHLKLLQQKYRSNTVECVSKAEPQAFPALRLLESPELADAYRWLCGHILEDFMSGTTGSDLPWRSLTPRQEEVLRKFIQTSDLEEGMLNKFKELRLPAEMEAIALILRGLLTYEVLLLALKKRWRVEYGVDSNGLRAMAVPFRAKDTAAERTEFGHVDLAVCLTQLSYYYSGLSDDQLEETLDRLMGVETREVIYASWVSVAGSNRLHPSIREFSGVNRADSSQIKLLLYPFLRYHMHCIDFFLSRIVFAKELKQFPSKIVATAWDLCPETRHNPVTGFSGTNDTQYLLPYFIRQNDLPELLGTNAQVCSYILQPENNNYEHLPPSCTGGDFLKRLVEFPRISVLIDAGALILELSNRQVAQQWLERRQEMKAVVYFNQSNQLCVLDRRGHAAKLRLSPYAGNLNDCLVYLDDVHTRGTDLKLPAGTQAAVTLGKGLRKDKFVQACMRMRQLGFSHSLSFWASAEVHAQIQAYASAEHVTSKHVLEWCIRNSIQTTQEGFLSWAWQGTSHLRLKGVVAQSDAAAAFPTSSQAIQHVGKNCAEKDQRTLAESFAEVRSLEAVSVIVTRWVKNLAYGEILASTCAKFIPRMKKYAHILDEQQERELEHELEEERMIQRPPPVEAVPETLTPGLIQVIRGSVPSIDEHFLPLVQALRQTSLYTEERAPFFQVWNARLLCSKTFAHVIRVEEMSSFRNNSHDAFLRPLRWVIISNDEQAGFTSIVAISPFEADEILQYMRSNSCSPRVSVRPFSVRRRFGETSLVFFERLTLNPSPTHPFPWDQYQNLYTELAVFSGELFLGDGEELCQNQALMCLFMGLCPKPHNDDEKEAFKNGAIAPDMFVTPNWRSRRAGTEFCSSPVKWIVNLYGLRGIVAELSVSHMGKILLFGVLPSPKRRKLLTVARVGAL